MRGRARKSRQGATRTRRTARTTRAKAIEPSYSREWMARWLNAYAEKGTVTAACRVVGVGRSTVYEAKDRDAEFAAEWEKAETETTELLEQTAYERAIGGSDRLMEFMLKARRPTKYRESVKVEHGGAIDTGTHEKLDEEIQKTNDDLRTEIDRLTERLAQVADRGQAAASGAAAGASLATAG